MHCTAPPREQCLAQNEQMVPFRDRLATPETPNHIIGTRAAFQILESGRTGDETRVRAKELETGEHLQGPAPNRAVFPI